MLDNGASLNVKDSEDRDLIMHAVMQNNLDLVKFFVNHAQGDFFNESRCN
jgi:ankyrin repeat protein